MVKIRGFLKIKGPNNVIKLRRQKYKQHLLDLLPEIL